MGAERRPKLSPQRVRAELISAIIESTPEISEQNVVDLVLSKRAEKNRFDLQQFDELGFLLSDLVKEGNIGSALKIARCWDLLHGTELQKTVEQNIFTNHRNGSGR